MSASDFWRVYVKGKNKELEDRVYMQWCSIIPYIKDPNLLSFKNYFDRATGGDLDRRDVDTILADIDEAMRRLNDGN